MFIACLSSLVLALSSRKHLVGEWNLYKGNYVEHSEGIAFSIEFHKNQTSGKTISTIWRSDDKARQSVDDSGHPKIAQLEIEFSSDNDGDIYVKGVNQAIHFKFDAAEDGRLTGKISYGKYTFDLIFVKDNILEITINNKIGEELDHYVAYKIDKIETVKEDKTLDRNTVKNHQIEKSLVNDFLIFIQSNIYYILVIGFAILLIQILVIVGMRKSQKPKEKKKQIQNKKNE